MITDSMIQCGVHYNSDSSIDPIYWNPETNDIVLTLDDNDIVLHGLECTSANPVTDEQLTGSLAALSNGGQSDVWALLSADGGLFVLHGNSESGEGDFYKGSANSGPVASYPYDVYDFE